MEMECYIHDENGFNAGALTQSAATLQAIDNVEI